MKRLVVIADSSLIVEAIRIGIRQGGEFNLVGHASTRTVRAPAIAEARPDVVLLDDLGASEQVVDLIREIREGVPAAAVLVLTIDMEPAWLNAVFDAGATGAISKETHPAALGTLIRETVNGHVVHIAAQSATPVSRPKVVAADDCSLTGRELEVLQLVAAGATNGEIARTLWVTEQTVKFHLSNVYRKLDVDNRTQASHYAHVNGLLAGSPVAAPA
jgi:DNA-binding NarL/FixJ family response regulator